jgi:ATP-dependent RNA helicase UAP56/SUB2
MLASLQSPFIEISLSLRGKINF